MNGSSFELQVSVLDLADLASRLGVDMKNMKVNIWASKVAGSTRTGLERLAGAKGMKLIGQAVEFRITVSTGSRSLEVKDFGGTYMVRAIVLEDVKAGGSYTAVVYDPSASSLSFVPAVKGTRSDDKKQLSMRSPHNSIYAIMETTNRSFDDLIGHWAKDDVELLAAKQIVEGVSDTRFAPNGKITRAEFLALLVRAMGLRTQADPTAQVFADVPANAWFASEVAAGVKAGLARGVTEERFDPNALVSREQMALMLANALTLAGEPAKAGGYGYVLASFADEEQVSPWARSAAERIAAAGIMRGTADGRMLPKAFATRAEAASTLKRLLLAVHFIDQ
ncbi:S-layer homology domain-containing protein [Cohnella rhizosphaerae]|uniref:S-layer homology domain-containing protein n=1 Tax=Cohnella rhizosphaerae TaxID=1457232 RepID=A0A9X4KXN6_9BACL|nr:S-layer homology domain-containing protein [Cohnella rhizosphaerae]MDG0810174.1 S-layer homology domain-containing protein [Cohnella rhizosphaerae]